MSIRQKRVASRVYGVSWRTATPIYLLNVFDVQQLYEYTTYMKHYDNDSTFALYCILI